MKIKKIFLKNLKKILPESSKNILIAVSGGIDSMVLLDLLLKCTTFSLTVAHVNFQLRSNYSDNDEFFVKNFCKKKKIPFFSKKVNIINYSNKYKCSIQMSARIIRYKWFFSLLKELKLDNIALGHHLNDTLETFFINMIRGSGLKGLLGIPATTKYIFRPLLIFTKNEIFEYAKNENIKWAEDSTNKENKYLRNSIRNRIIPILLEISPNLYKTFSKLIENLKIEYNFSEKLNKNIIKEITIKKVKNPFKWEINLIKLRTFNPLKAYFFKLFYTYGFYNFFDLKNLLNSQSGKQIFSKTHRIINDRNKWILIEKKYNKKITYKIDKNIKYIKEPITLYFKVKEFNENEFLLSKKEEFIVYLDYEKIYFPIILRKWNSGDYFYPLGMVNKQKISKFFKNKKFSILEKENIWLLVNGDKSIIYIINYRIDNRFKIKKKTNKVLKIISLKEEYKKFN